MSNRKTTTSFTSVPLSDADHLFVVEYCKDCNARRAARAVGRPADKGAVIRAQPDVSAAIAAVFQRRESQSDIDADWLKWELVDNHQIGRQLGNLPASNAALNMLAKLGDLDAYAAEKVHVTTDEELMERLRRGRARNAKGRKGVSFL